MRGRENDECQQYVFPFDLSFIFLAIYDFCPYLVITQEVKRCLL